MKELSLHILDITQNSIRAGASLVKLTINENVDDNLLEIIIEDNGKGIPADKLPSITDPFVTTRTTRRVGLGLSLFKDAAEGCYGRFEIHSEENVGTRVYASFAYDHIDRMPLGNMADTMCILMGCNEQINFSFTYRVGEKAFTVSTAQLQEILAGVPLNTPQVMDFIRGYIKENMDLLSGGAS